MYNIASTSYRNLPIQAQAPKKSRESFGLLSRNAEPKMAEPKDKTPRERVAEYVMEIRKEREKLRNG